MVFNITQLSATATSRAAFMQCLRWGIWCPFQEPADWDGEEIQLTLQGGAKPNPHGVMVYSAQMSAKTQKPTSAPDIAQVIQQHRVYLTKEHNVNNAFKGAEISTFQHSLRCFLELSHYLNCSFGKCESAYFDKVSYL